MSYIATGIVQRRKIGSPTRKAVLMFMAACASDDGSGIWTSKKNMADDLEMGRRTVQVCIDDLSASGLITETGRRSCRNGFTVEYCINLDAVQALESTRDDAPRRASPAPQSTRAGDAHVQDVHMTRASPARQDVQLLHPNLTGTILEQSKKEPLVVPHDEKPPDKARLPSDWTLSDEGWTYARSKKIPDEDIADEARGFHAYWSDRTDGGGRKSAKGWEQCWQNRVRDIAPRYQRNIGVAGKAGTGRHGQGSSLASVVARRWAAGEV